MRGSKYTAALLAPLAQASRTMAELLRKLGLHPTGGNYRHISKCLRVAKIDTSHFHRSRDEITKDILASAVRDSRSVAQVLAKLNLPLDGRPHRDMSRRIQTLGLDTSHFQGRGWSRGLSAETNASVAASRKKQMLPNEVVFIANSPGFISASNMVRRLVALGRVYACEWCGISEWRGKRLVLHIDHANGINNDNRLPNLRFLCPNCHSQTPTYGNRRR